MKFLIIGVLAAVIAVGGVFVYRSRTENPTNKNSSYSTETEDVRIATDPSFPQLRGGYYEQIPKMPVYPDAVLVGSAKTNPENMKDTGYRILWKSNTSVPVVMKWASEQFKLSGWKTDELGDPDNEGEQVMQIDNDRFTGTFSAEHEGENEINIIVQIFYK